MTPIVCAHAGGSPENTLEAIARTRTELRDVWLEVDVRSTSDGELVLLHDPTLDRTTSGTGPVIETARADLPREVPTLREALALGGRWMLELKNIPGEPDFDPTGERLASALRALLIDVTVDELIVTSFYPATLDALEGLPTGLLSSSRYGFSAEWNLGRGYGLCSPNHDAPDLTAEWVARAHASGRRVATWTPNTDEELRAAVAKGIDWIITDRPERLLELLGS